MLNTSISRIDPLLLSNTSLCTLFFFLPPIPKPQTPIPLCKPITKPQTPNPPSKPPKPPKTRSAPSKKLKNAKTELQILTLKYFHDTYHSSPESTDLITQICDYTGFSRRQVYKWFWDENSRRRLRSPVANAELSLRIQRAYEEVFELLKENVFRVRGMVLKAVYVPAMRVLNEDNNRAVWNLKLAGLGSETILMRPREG